MKHTVFVVGVCLILGMMLGASAAVQPVACDRDNSFMNFPLTGSLSAQSDAAPVDCGLVHPHASVATLAHGATQLKVALDSDSATAKRLSLLRLDLAGTGKFSKDYTVRILYQGADSASICTTQLQLTRDGMTLPVTVSGQMYRQGEGAFQVMLWLTSALQDTCDIGGKSYAVRVIDADDNLHFGDSMPAPGGKMQSLYESSGDTVYIDTGDGDFSDAQTIVKGFYGHPTFLNNAWYVIKLSDDHKQIVATPFQGDMGRIKMHAAGWSGMMVGEKYMLNLTDLPQEMSFPVDRYMLLTYSEAMPANGSAKQAEKVENYTNQQRPKTFEVKTGTLAAPVLGMPLQAVISTKRTGNTVEFSFALRDSGGTDVMVNLSNRGAIANPVAFTVLDANKKVVHSGKFEFGLGGYCTDSWRVPQNVKGTFTAHITTMGNTDVPHTAKDMTFTVK